MSQLGDTSVGDPWRRPPLLFSSLRRAMVGCPPEIYPQAHNTHHSYPLPTHSSHKYGDDRVLHRLVREEVEVRAPRPKARGRLKNLPAIMNGSRRLWLGSELPVIFDPQSFPAAGQLRPILLVFSDSETSSTCSCAWRVKPECCRMPDQSKRGWGLPGRWSNGL